MRNCFPLFQTKWKVIFCFNHKLILSELHGDVSNEGMSWNSKTLQILITHSASLTLQSPGETVTLIWKILIQKYVVLYKPVHFAKPHFEFTELNSDKKPNLYNLWNARISLLYEVLPAVVLSWLSHYINMMNFRS